MSFVQSAIGQIVGTLLQLLLAILSRDRRSLIIERRSKVLTLAKEMKAAGFTPRQLRDLERRLTSGD
jgi:hypothetical protein